MLGYDDLQCTEIPSGNKCLSDINATLECKAIRHASSSFSNPSFYELSYHSPKVDPDDFTVSSRFLVDRRQVAVEGMLEKWCSWGSTFKPRYFVLEKCGRLSYFKSDLDRLFPERAKRVVPINVDTSLAVAQTRRRDRITIEIRPARDTDEGGRTLRLGFGSHSDSVRWHLALAEAQRSVIYVTSFILRRPPCADSASGGGHRRSFSGL